MEQKELNSVLKLSIACGFIFFIASTIMIYLDPSPTMKYGEAGGLGILVAFIWFIILWITRLFEPLSIDKNRKN